MTEPIYNKDGIDLGGEIYYATEADFGGDATLIEKSITANGTYYAQDDEADGYSEVSVSVPNKLAQTLNKSIETLTADDFLDVTTLVNQQFRGCDHLTSVELSDSVTSISDFCFGSCSELVSVHFGSGITTISGYAFYGAGLTFVLLPSTLTSIGNCAFQFNSRLTKVCGIATNPPTLGVAVFSDTNDCPIYVPYASIDTYKAATNWTTYATRIFPLVATVGDLTNIDTTAYTRACVIGTDESYKEYAYDGSQWNEI